MIYKGERLSPCILCSSLPFEREKKKKIPEKDFNLLGSWSWKRRRAQWHSERSVPSWAPKSAIFIKMYESYTGLDVLPAAHISVSLSLRRWKSHLIQFDNRTGSWFEKCSSHHSRDTHNTHMQTHNTLSASLVYGLPAAPPLPINFIGS